MRPLELHPLDGPEVREVDPEAASWLVDGHLRGHTAAQTLAYVSRRMDEADRRAAEAQGPLILSPDLRPRRRRRLLRRR